MASSIIDGPYFAYGSLAAILAAVFGQPVGDPNPDAGPSGFYQGMGFIDPRFYFNKDQVQGYTGRVPMHYSQPDARSVSQIPAAVSTSNVAAAQGVNSGVAMTLATTSVTGVTTNIPYIPFSQAGLTQLATGANVQNCPIMLDYGFQFANVAAGNATITVADTNEFQPGQPLVIANCGNSAGTAALLTNVSQILTSTTMTLLQAPQATVNPTPIGSGNIWGPSETWSTLQNMLPTAHLPWIACGSGLILDARQAVTRCISITGAAGGTGGTFTVRGIDIYNVACTQTITVAAGSNTVYGTKALKGVLSVTANFTDASHNYTVGTSDVFGIHYRTPQWDDLAATWANLAMTGSTGFVAGQGPSATATALTGDTRGTIQTSNSGPNSGIGSTASNGTVSNLAMSGNRLTILSSLVGYRMVYSTANSFVQLFGVNQF